MDPGLHEIYAKETAGHLATIREFIAACDTAPAPYPVTEALHRSCHTLSGTAKTAGARQGIKVAEPLNRYVRKLYDNSIGMAPAGLEVLKDASVAIQQVVDHIDADTGRFLDHVRIVTRLNELEQAIDQEISRLAETLDPTRASPVLTETHLPAAPARAAAAGVEEPEEEIEIIELEPTDASTLSLLNWSYENFPAPAKQAAPQPASAKRAAQERDEELSTAATILRPALVIEEPTNVQPALADPESVAAIEITSGDDTGILVEEA
ncbi:MAG: hypothetical protein ACREI7_13010, partial [Myxococcota bacterium]